MEYIEIPSSVKVIEWLPFFNCKKLKKIKIPKSVESADFLFNNCHKDLVLEVESGSYMEKYAKENNIKYIVY
ncbi:MAG: leucine-rich repeat protein [Clostridia bacterium]|nr:leucine-rich repeat protein [Clostridia bacterium]